MSNFSFKKIMVMGAGGVGGYFGGKLAQLPGTELSFVARGRHLEEIQKNGLIVEGDTNSFVVHGPASEHPEDLPDPDLILFTVKSHDTTDAIELIRPKAGSNTQILPLQNGIENMPKLVDAFGYDRVIHGLCRIGVHISEPGRLLFTSRGSVIIGEKDGSRSPRTESVKNMFDEAGVSCKISDNIVRDTWLKFAWNTIFNMITAAENRTTDYFFSDGKPDTLLWKLAGEIQEVAKAEGVALRDGDMEKLIHKTEGMGAFVTSTLHDRRSGKKMEYDAFTGALLRLSDKHGMDLPEYRKLHKELKRVDKD